MVGPQNGDQMIGPGELVAVVGDIGQEVGGVAIGLDEHPILVVAEFGGPQPQRAIFFEHVAAGPQLGEGGLDGAGVHQRPLRGPRVELHPEASQRLAG